MVRNVRGQLNLRHCKWETLNRNTRSIKVSSSLGLIASPQSLQLFFVAKLLVMGRVVVTLFLSLSLSSFSFIFPVSFLQLKTKQFDSTKQYEMTERTMV